MAQQGSGTKAMGATIDPAMVDQTHYNARSGAAKRAQTSFETKWGMKDMNKASGVTAGVDPNKGAWANPPDASSPNPLDPEPKGKLLRRMSETIKSAWGMVDGMGNGVDQNIGGKVIGEAILSGSSRLPVANTEIIDTGNTPKPWPASDSN